MKSGRVREVLVSGCLGFLGTFPFCEASPCDANCFFEDTEGTCRDRVEWTKANTYRDSPDPCNKAHSLVLSQCDTCSSCTASDLGCPAVKEGDFVTTTYKINTEKQQVEGSAACTEVCLYNDRMATCTERILWAAHQEFGGRHDNCDLAHGLVMEECPICSPCLLKNTGCEIDGKPSEELEYECQLGLERWHHDWPEDKKAWCCENRGLACPTTTTGSSGHAETSYLCSVFDDPKTWKKEKQDWCCKQEKLGCPESNEELCGGEALKHWEIWSEDQKSWCFKRSNFAMLHRCSPTDVSWSTGWSDSKQTWCCLYDEEWSRYKSEWCCKRQGVKCDEAYGDFSSKYQALNRLQSIVHTFPLSSLLISSVLGASLAIVVYRILLCDVASHFPRRRQAPPRNARSVQDDSLFEEHYEFDVDDPTVLPMIPLRQSYV
eukprot:CAMPEP_0206468142 /NCGR_PEP_ID=MMETSP0324_2-20121206/29442_1 /ASSEMBLY_ACC=CAM_ASM_000836 /TAXON_ID=2866 /ORGANISM="Crypthecodinium cohnii, Strain Seligo" /LENGTH=432 /DNA_ID=CAMNT_0053941521 /DNA_START=14 /DNA_END=1312 /DNA_ORIENTATION=-